MSQYKIHQKVHSKLNVTYIGQHFNAAGCNCSKMNFYKTTPIPDACRWIPLEKLVCLLDFSHLYAPVSVSYSQIRFFP